MRPFAQVDVFCSGALSGNPLAVVLDADGLTTAEMHRLARWTNLSETAFLMSASDPRADYRARIFTPAGELPFAGHPTLGSCHVWLEQRAPGKRGGRVIQQCEAGLVALQAGEDGIAFNPPPLRRSGPLGEGRVRHIARLIGVDRSEIIDDQWADNGPGWAAVMLGDAERVLSLQPGVVDLDVGVIGAHPPGGPADFEVRAFYPKHGATAEDPVTGSLNAGIAHWLLGDGRISAPYKVRQGTALGHDGRVTISSDADGAIWVGGETNTIISGVIAL